MSSSGVRDGEEGVRRRLLTVTVDKTTDSGFNPKSEKRETWGGF